MLEAGVEITIEVAGDVFVPVVEVGGGRGIGWGKNVGELLTSRLDDIHEAVGAGAIISQPSDEAARHDTDDEVEQFLADALPLTTTGSSM